MKKRIWIFLLCSIFFSGLTFAQEAKKLRKVVIDPGHGGNKPGAVGKVSKEKDITLSVALKLGKLIKQHFTDVEVIYTRTKDEDVDLYKRAQVANKAKADLFISIHANSSKSKEASGHETFVMGLAKSSANLEIAKKENADILLEDNYKDNPNYQGFDPNSSESYIMFALYQNSYLFNSLELSSAIQSQYAKNLKYSNRGVKQAEFFVLYKTAMPSVLTEVGFISNEKEELYMISEEGQKEIVYSLLHAFNEYKSYIDGTEKKKLPFPEKKEGQLQKDLDAGESSKDAEESITLVVQKDGFVKEVKTESSPSEKSSMYTKDTLKTVNPERRSSKGEGVEYRVQFLVSKQKLSLSDKKFKDLDSVQMYEYEGTYRYTLGKEKSIDGARRLIDFLKTKNFKDAFIVAFYQNKRISMQEALKLQQASDE